MRAAPVVLLLLLSVCASGAELTLEDRKARADHARGGDKAKLALEYSEHAADAANKDYADGNFEHARVLLKDVADYSEIAASAAFDSGKRVKQTEIGLRKLVNQLVNVKRSVEFEEQHEVQAAIDAVNDARSRLIEKLFGKQNPVPIEDKK